MFIAAVQQAGQQPVAAVVAPPPAAAAAAAAVQNAAAEPVAAVAAAQQAVAAAPQQAPVLIAAAPAAAATIDTAAATAAAAAAAAVDNSSSSSRLQPRAAAVLALFWLVWGLLCPALAAALFKAAFLLTAEEWQSSGVLALTPLHWPEGLPLGLCLLHTWAYACHIGVLDGLKIAPFFLVRHVRFEAAAAAPIAAAAEGAAVPAAAAAPAVVVVAGAAGDAPPARPNDWQQRIAAVLALHTALLQRLRRGGNIAAVAATGAAAAVPAAVPAAGPAVVQAAPTASALCTALLLKFALPALGALAAAAAVPAGVTAAVCGALLQGKREGGWAASVSELAVTAAVGSVQALLGRTVITLSALPLPELQLLAFRSALLAYLVILGAQVTLCFALLAVEIVR
jgi:trimeric autotransporter adhesin